MQNKIKKIIDEVKGVGVNFLSVIPELLSPEIVSDPDKIISSALKSIVISYLNKFKQEYEDKKKKGKIKENNFYTEKPALTLIEFMKIIDEGNLEEERFKAIKSIFFSGISKEATKKDEILAYEFLNTAKKISGTEVLILKANFELFLGKLSFDFNKEALKNAQSKRSLWKMIVIKQMGYEGLTDIITKYEINLESLGLISPRCADTRFSDDFEPTKKYRLTEIGYKLCEFMTKDE